VLFRNKAQVLSFALRDGMAVEVRAVPTMYDARGEFQLNVDSVRLAGLGALYERFARLKDKLQAAGWFADDRKRSLPPFPQVVGVVTSRRAAALRDILTTLARRAPRLRVVVYPAAVQGPGAADELAAAIRTANRRAEVDVLIVCRGGGSLEDLWSFNEPAVARAVYESSLPVVSGVGHETDFTICDFVADVRAPTPTAAAMLVSPDRPALLHRIAQLAHRFLRAQQHDMGSRAQRVDAVARRLVHPAAHLARQGRQARELGMRLARAVRHRVDRDATRVDGSRRRLLRELRLPLPGTRAVAHAAMALPRCGRARVAQLKGRLEALSHNLAHLNPRAVLDRGYAIVTRGDGGIVQDARELAPGAQVSMTFARGSAGATVTRVDEP
jgi:exodeoxyribonuclease VII large subunit